jgi:hypothetical protein
MVDKFCKSSPYETAGLEQLRANGIRELPPGVNDKSSQCLLLMLLPFVFVDDAPQFVEFVPGLDVEALLLLLYSL